MMPSVNLVRLFAVCLAALSLGGIGSAAALDYPTRPVRWIVPYTPGGATDITARIVAQRLSERLGQQVFIENKLGIVGGIRHGPRKLVNQLDCPLDLRSAARRQRLVPRDGQQPGRNRRAAFERASLAPNVEKHLA